MWAVWHVASELRCLSRCQRKPPPPSPSPPIPSVVIYNHFTVLCDCVCVFFFRRFRLVCCLILKPFIVAGLAARGLLASSSTPEPGIAQGAGGGIDLYGTVLRCEPAPDDVEAKVPIYGHYRSIWRLTYLVLSLRHRCLLMSDPLFASKTSILYCKLIVLYTKHQFNC